MMFGYRGRLAARLPCFAVAGTVISAIRLRHTSASLFISIVSLQSGKFVGHQLWPHPAPLRAEFGRQQFIGRGHPLAEQRARVARVNDLFDAEGFGSSEWRAQPAEHLFNLPAARV